MGGILSAGGDENRCGSLAVSVAQCMTVTRWLEAKRHRRFPSVTIQVSDPLLLEILARTTATAFLLKKHTFSRFAAPAFLVEQIADVRLERFSPAKAASLRRRKCTVPERLAIWLLERGRVFCCTLQGKNVDFIAHQAALR